MLGQVVHLYNSKDELGSVHGFNREAENGVPCRQPFLPQVIQKRAPRTLAVSWEICTLDEPVSYSWLRYFLARPSLISCSR